MTLDTAKGDLLVLAGVLIAYAAYKAYTTSQAIATGVTDTTRKVYKTATDAVDNAKCGGCIAAPWLCDTFNATWMQDCNYNPLNRKTLQPGTPNPNAPFDPNAGPQTALASLGSGVLYDADGNPVSMDDGPSPPPQDDSTMYPNGIDV